MTILFTLQEVAKCNGQNGTSTYIVVRDVIYDVTSYLNEHPGGPELLQEYAGKDATNAFDDSHTSDARKLLKKYKIGELIDEDKIANRRKNQVKNTRTKEDVNKYKKENIPIGRAFLSVLCGKCA